MTDTLGFVLVPAESLTACDHEQAYVQKLSPAETLLDTLAHEYTARFCSAPAGSAATARYDVILPAGGFGKLKVVAIDPDDPRQEHVIESNEVTYNGGHQDPYPPVVLRAITSHTTAVLEVAVVGVGLTEVTRLALGAVDTLWRVNLNITAAADSVLRAVAEVPIKLPAAELTAESPWGISNCGVAAEPQALVVANTTSVDTILFRDPDPNIYPHDFAFAYSSVPTLDPAHPWKGVFHLFYIRTVKSTGADSIIAHAWCDTLGRPWSVDLQAFRPSGVGWDKTKVWAPSIQQVGNKFYMFYTGVDSLGRQSIGYASTSVLGTTNISWDRQKVPVLRADSTSWARTTGKENPPALGFRDPFVMSDPDHPGRLLLFFVAEDKDINLPSSSPYAVGVVRNRAGTLNGWFDVGKYPATDWNHLGLSRVESPLVVRDSLSGAWRMFVANANYDALGHLSTYFLTQSAGDSVTALSSGRWPQRDSLYAYLGNDVDVVGWQACEHLQIGPVHYFAAYVGPDGIGITRMHWNAATQKFIFVRPDFLDVPNGRGMEHPGLWLSEYRPRQNRIILSADLQSRGQLLDLFDLSGRRVRRLVLAEGLPGLCGAVWDCRDENGVPAPSGLYFARLRGAAGSALRLVIAR